MKSHLLRLLFAIALICAPLFFVPETAHAQSYVTYTVQPGDTLSKISRQYCTNWQTIYNINQQAIGPNPNNLTAGTVLTVPNNCSSGGGGGSSGVYDRGPRTGATGTYYAPYYTVAWGDNLSSIAARFGVSVSALQQANNMWDSTVYAGMVLTIPTSSSGGGTPPPPPNPSWPPGTERVQFAPGAIAASRTGTTGWGQPKYYVLTAMAGQQMEIYTTSHGDPLTVSVTQPNNMNAALGGTNNHVSNYLFMTLPMTGDYLITVTPAVVPESQTVPFDITFAIR